MASHNSDEMAPKDVLFEAIAYIKKGHNKPNTARICSYLQRKYNLAANRCIKAINHYSNTGDIVAVNVGAPAGDLSYRIADPPCLDALNALKGSMINKFVAELIINEPNYLTDGVPPSRLVSFVAQKQPTLSRKEILESIRAELDLGNLDTFENGNYGYFPLDSSDEDEPEDKKLKLSPSAAKTKAHISPSKASPKSVPPSTPKANGTKPAAATTKQMKVGAASSEKAPVEVKRERKQVAKVDDKEERKENLKKVEERSIITEKEDGRRRRMKKRKCYADRDEDFQPGSKDFKVDLSLERQSRKRKEKKIFDPSADESKTRRRGQAAQSQSNTSQAGGSTVQSAGTKKLISPNKKLIAGSSVKVGSGPGVQVRTNITPLVPTSVCYLCQTYGKRIKGVPEKLISCTKCSVSKAHISCLNDARAPDEKILAPSALVNDWTCAKCNWTFDTMEKCVYCNEFKAGIYILECIECKSGFHVPCHKSLIPPLNKDEPIVPDKFKCVRCEPTQQKGSSQDKTPPLDKPKEADPAPTSPRPRPIIVVKHPPPVSQPKVTVTQLRPKVTCVSVGTEMDESVKSETKADSKVGINNNLFNPHPKFLEDPQVPDCKDWTSREVYKYLSQHLLDEVCQQVLEADVDGKALLLLKRADCVSMLDLPVGFGLKLWCQVQRLQTRISDVELFYGEF